MTMESSVLHRPVVTASVERALLERRARQERITAAAAKVRQASEIEIASKPPVIVVEVKSPPFVPNNDWPIIRFNPARHLAWKSGPVFGQRQPLYRVNAAKLRAIQHEVAEYFEVSREDMVSKRRAGFVIWPRHVAMYLCKQLTACSLTDIGRAFNRDHTTTLWAVRKVEMRREDDGGLADLLCELEARIGHRINP